MSLFHVMRRRDLLVAASAAMLASGARASGAATPEDHVRRQAMALAAKPYCAPPNDLPASLAIDYDGYRDLRFRPEKAIWRDLGLPFQLQMFHRGGMAADRVDFAEWAGGRVRPILYSSDLFTFGRVEPGPLPPTLGFAGFRIHAPINRPDYFDEVAVFLGASYFRAVGQDEAYGLSARGLALNAGEGPEEFPRFLSYLIERPAAGATALNVHAVLDSPSVAGAYHFRITPGSPTHFDVQLSLFPRQDLTTAGIAPLTSMYLFGNEQPRRYDDFRPEVHDSDGLLIANGAGERIWRPLVNPQPIATQGNQVSAFRDENPHGFGLQQRNRDFGAYQDLEANYHRRPGAWITPTGGFGRGDVRLVELTARNETEDNIVASWRPETPLTAGREHRFSYGLDWGGEPPAPQGLALARSWRTGAVIDWSKGKPDADKRLFVVEFGPLDGLDGLRAEVSASKGQVANVVVQANAAAGGVRLHFQFDPDGPVADLRAALYRGPAAVSEVWVQRWLAPDG